MSIFTINATEQEQRGSFYHGWYANGHAGNLRHPADGRAALECYRRSAKLWRWALRFDKAAQIEQIAKSFRMGFRWVDEEAWKNDPVVATATQPSQPPH